MAQRRPPVSKGQNLKNDPLFKVGYEEGERDMKNKALTFLEQYYLSDDAPARGTEEAHAILDLARDLSEHLNGPRD